MIPLRTNREPKRRPRVTETIIVVNMLVYLAGLLAEYSGVFDREVMLRAGQLASPVEPWRFVTYAFLHDPRGIWHLAANMLFLWVFGGAVEDRMGRASFLGFYLIGGAVAGLAHVAVEPMAPVIGASGAVSAVTGAFLALFPRSRILVFFFGIFAVPALWVIGLYFSLDILNQVFVLFGPADGDVAYMAHIAGSIYGFALAFLLLAMRIVPREEFDVFFLFKQARRRAAMQRATDRSAGMTWASSSADTGRRLAKKKQRAPELTEAEKAEATYRRTVRRHLEAHDLPAAAAAYAQLLEQKPDATLLEGDQLDVANQLHAEGRDELAARAYERLLATYPVCRNAPEVRLLLALLYVRQLDRATEALPLLEGIEPRLSDDAQKTLARELRTEATA